MVENLSKALPVLSRQLLEAMAGTIDAALAKVAGGAR